MQHVALFAACLKDRAREPQAMFGPPGRYRPLVLMPRGRHTPINKGVVDTEEWRLLLARTGLEEHAHIEDQLLVIAAAALSGRSPPTRR